MFETRVSGGIPRRAFLLTPFAFAGLITIYSKSQEFPLPDAAANGSGDEVSLALFGADGQSTGEARVRKIVRTDEEWKHQLSASEYTVTRRGGTERAYTGRYWNNHEAGLYRCVCCGNALFRSQDKFESGTGWPSFSAAISDRNIAFAKDNSLLISRTEVLCAKCDAHLGHVFNDGPAPTGLRYCMNSMALRFEAA